MNNSEHNVAGKSRGRSKVVYGGTVDSSSSAMLQRASETDNVEEREEIFSKCDQRIVAEYRSLDSSKTKKACVTAENKEAKYYLTLGKAKMFLKLKNK